MTDAEHIIHLQLQVDDLDASRRALASTLAVTLQREVMLRVALEEIGRLALRALEPWDGAIDGGAK